MAGRAHSTLGTLGPPPPFGDNVDVDDAVDGGDVDDDVGSGEVYDDVGDAVDGCERDDQPRSFHPPANSEDSPQLTSHLDSEPDILCLRAEECSFSVVINIFSFDLRLMDYFALQSILLHRLILDVMAFFLLNTVNFIIQMEWY